MNIKKINLECPFCGKGNNVYLNVKKVINNIKNQEVECENKSYFCKSCKEDFMDGELLNQNLLKIKDEYRKNNQLLTSKEIALIRGQYSLSQADFSLLLGWGEVTITRYESKTIQDQTYDMILRMAKENPYFVLQMLEKNKDVFTIEKYNKIKDSIINIIYMSGEDYLIKEKLLEQYLVYLEPSDKNGYTILDFEKLNNIVGIIAKKVGLLHKVILMKILWYIDQLSYKNYGKSVTGLVYRHEEMGALPIANESIIKLPSLLTTTEYSNNEKFCYNIRVNSNFKPKSISPKLEAIIDTVIDKFGSKNSQYVIEYMHKENAYKETKEHEIIPFIEEYKINNI
ncbi:MAG: DUF4065 domain-containing protein [Endomicrobiaceae bacterium]|nr:DUF4065 domain-containing protein [Endomicrobiaceae bacterium]